MMTGAWWRYKGTRQYVSCGDRVDVSKSFVDRHAEYNSNRRGTVIDLCGFITVQMDENKDKVDFDSRSVSFVCKGSQFIDGEEQ